MGEGSLKAKLTVQFNGNTRTVYIQFVNGDADGIIKVKSEGMKSEKSADSVYDLSGCKVNSNIKFQNSKLPQGIYIVNGKKVFVR